MLAGVRTFRSDFAQAGEEREKRAKREAYKKQRRAMQAGLKNASASTEAEDETYRVRPRVASSVDSLKLANDFFRDGYCVVRNALLPETVASFRAQIVRELQRPVLPVQNRTSSAVDDVATWPRGGKRRVAECLPSGRGAHWSAIAAAGTFVAAALDAIMGAGDWELPFNPRDIPADKTFSVRHWYAPIVFPEHHPEEYDEDDATAALRRDAKTWGDIDEGMWTADEDDRVVSAFKKHGPKWGAISSLAQGKTKAQVRVRLAKLLLPGAARKIDCIDATSSWRAVNRRRVPDKGWHVDIGPGFDTDWKRDVAGHRFQGCVLLVLLSDCPRGHGGQHLSPVRRNGCALIWKRQAQRSTRTLTRGAYLKLRANLRRGNSVTHAKTRRKRRRML